MRHIDALNRFRALFRRDDTVVSPDDLSGPTLFDQEPDLAREAARYNVAASSWAAGHSTD